MATNCAAQCVEREAVEDVLDRLRVALVELDRRGVEGDDVEQRLVGLATACTCGTASTSGAQSVGDALHHPGETGDEGGVVSWSSPSPWNRSRDRRSSAAPRTAGARCAAPAPGLARVRGRRRTLAIRRPSRRPRTAGPSSSRGSSRGWRATAPTFIARASAWSEPADPLTQREARRVDPKALRQPLAVLLGLPRGSSTRPDPLPR